MLIDTTITIAYKCSSCGSFEFFNVSLFTLFHKKEFLLTCRCNKSRILITRENSSIYKIRASCISCGNVHIYDIERKKMLRNKINVMCCPENGMQQCFIGNDEDVRKKVDSYQNEMDEIINMFGYDNYFKNTQVMFDVLNKIHDVAEQGNLYCECGNSDIELILFSDSIHLKCKSCAGSKVIYAASYKDLKNVSSEHGILLLKGEAKKSRL